jgi:CCR4-NOT complex subunit CAF16
MVSTALTITVSPRRLTVSAGKSTLLRILAGKRLTKSRNCRILGKDVFMNPPSVRLGLIRTNCSSRSGLTGQGVVYLGTEWSSNPVVRSDIVVSDFLDSVGGYRHKARRDRLLGILDVDLDWSVPSSRITRCSPR